MQQEALYFTIFAVKQEDTHHNIFTCVRNRIEVPLFDWRSFSGKHGVVRFEACLSVAEGARCLGQMTADQSFACMVQGKEIRFTFGELKKRAPVFIPNSYDNSVGSGWWPGTLRHGFWLNEWYSLNASYQPRGNTVKFIRDSTGFDLERLPDLVNTIIQISSLEAYTPRIEYNPDSKTVTFRLESEVEAHEHRVAIQLWETKESLYRELIDLPEGVEHVTITAPFEPERTGFELYIKRGGRWELAAAASHVLMRKMHLQMGIITGKLTVHEGGKTEKHDIVSYQQQPVIGPDAEEPWVTAEEERIRLNKAAELRQLGSIFVRHDGQGTRDQLLKIIHNVIYKSADQLLYIWDPYLNKSVLDKLLVKAITIPSMKIRLLYSEHGKKKPGELDVAGSVAEALAGFPRSKEMYDYLEQHRNKPLGNLEIRNWFRKGEHAFHDRFMITEHAVFHLGSSLKDIGNYHSTIYRLPEDLAQQVRKEFMLAWAGDFGVSKTYGFSLAPAFEWLGQQEGAVGR